MADACDLPREWGECVGTLLLMAVVGLALWVGLGGAEDVDQAVAAMEGR